MKLLLPLSLFASSAFGLVCNGLESNCDKPVNQVMFPGTHASNAFAPTEQPDGTSRYTQNANWNIYEQFKAGVRFFEFSVYLGENNEVFTDVPTGGFPRITTDKLLDVSDMVAVGLDEFPTDVAIIVIRNVAGISETQFGRGMFRLGPKAYTITEDNKKGIWPKLSDRQAMNFRRAFVFVDAPMGDYPLYQDYFQETNDQVTKISDFTCYLQGASKQFLRVQHHLWGGDRSDQTLLNRTNQVNSEANLKDHIGKCTRFVNALSVNWGKDGDLIKVANAYNAAGGKLSGGGSPSGPGTGGSPSTGGTTTTVDTGKATPINGSPKDSVGSAGYITVPSILILVGLMLL
jgi:hypothetical protein